MNGVARSSDIHSIFGDSNARKHFMKYEMKRNDELRNAEKKSQDFQISLPTSLDTSE